MTDPRRICQQKDATFFFSACLTIPWFRDVYNGGVIHESAVGTPVLDMLLATPIP